MSDHDRWNRAHKLVNDMKPPRGVCGAVCHDPESFVVAAFREIEAATRAKVLTELEAFVEACPEDQTSQALAEFLYRLRGTP